MGPLKIAHGQLMFHIPAFVNALFGTNAKLDGSLIFLSISFSSSELEKKSSPLLQKPEVWVCHYGMAPIPKAQVMIMMAK